MNDSPSFSKWLGGGSEFSILEEKYDIEYQPGRPGLSGDPESALRNTNLALREASWHEENVSSKTFGWHLVDPGRCSKALTFWLSVHSSSTNIVKIVQYYW